MSLIPISNEIISYENTMYFIIIMKENIKYEKELGETPLSPKLLSQKFSL